MFQRQRRLRVLVACAAVALGAASLPASAVAAPTPGAAVDRAVIDQLAGGGTAGFLVYLRDQADLSGASKIKDPDARAEHVYKELVRTAERSQSGLRAALDTKHATYRPFWISNVVWVQGDLPLLNSLSSRSEVLKVEPAKTYKLITPVESKSAATKGLNAAEWGLTNIEAPRVWSDYGVRGEGIVVANIDSGVQFDHPALVRQYRGNLGNGQFDHNYNWVDPARVCGTPSVTPCDNNGHGTHTMGTMVGDDGAGNQIGVAPGARWFSAKGCELLTCSNESLLAAAQFVLAPTDLNGANPRPDLHADVVNNSWGGNGNDLWYSQSVNSWIAAGIFPMFSNGNSGPACQTAGSPGDYPQSYSVGAYDINNAIASFSSRGSSLVDNGIKPNIAAPGVNVRSSLPGSTYGANNGTSMAAPHVSGTVALMWAAAPAIKGDITATRNLLDTTATNVDATTCGGTAADNNVFGEGRLNAYQAVTASPRGPAGRAVGVVTDAATGNPVDGVRVSAGELSALTGADGRYTLLLPVGQHTLTASKYGFATQTATVTVPEGGAVTQNFALTALPLVTVSGQVTDGSGKGWPLYARIDVTGRPGGPVFTNPANGRYSFQIASGSTFRFTTTAQYQGYQTVTQDVAIGTGNKTHNIAVPVDPACNALGYQVAFGTPVLREEFNATTTPAGWSVVNRTASGGWGFTDTGARGNLTGGAGGFAIIDSDKLGSGNSQDTDLITPPLDFSGATAPHVRFNSDYRAFPNSTADIDVSTDGGTTWINVWRQTSTDRRGPRVETVPLAPAAGDSDALIRFRYRGTFAWWWELDNVEFLNRGCQPLPGGLVVGFTTDRTTNSALNGVTVASDEAPGDRGVSVATPDDPAIADGFFHLFSGLTGARSFTASKGGYQSQTKSVTVVDGGTRSVNFALGSGRITVTPANLEAHVPFGATRRTTVTVRNTGTAPTEVTLTERSGTFELLSQRGAALDERNVQGLSQGKVSPQGSDPARAGVLIDPAWTRIADYPVPIFDNVAATFDGKVYSVGGADTATERKLFAYDIGTATWAALPDMPSGRAKPTATFVGGKLYVIGGWNINGVPVSSVDVYDPATNSWATVPGANNPRARASAGWGVVGGKIYLVGGCTDSACTKSADVVIFDTVTNAFSLGAAYPQITSWTSCGAINGGVICAGGAGASTFRNGFRYDPASDAWSPIADMPIDLWGSQFSTANGLLVLAGGVTNNSGTITNRTLAYDPQANTWANLPNAQFALFRGAAACGFFKLGGSPGFFQANREAERLGGLELCEEDADVPWLSLNPTTFTLNPGQSRNVTVTVAATAEGGVLQPGQYTAQIGIRAATPFPVPTVNVTMNVSPPPSWGKIQGTVLGQPCSGNPVGVAAFVRINLVSNPEIGYSVRADNAGRYAIWLPAGRYEVIVAKDTWVPEVARHKVDAGFVGQLDFTLAPFTPCLNGPHRA